MIVDAVLVGLGGALLLFGLIGCIIPVVPGPILAYLALISAGIAGGFGLFPAWVLIATAVAAVATTVLDNILPARASRRAGAGRPGTIGSIVGMLAGTVFFPPFGVFLGAFAGALVGEVMFNPDNTAPMKSALAVFRGTILAMILKIATVGWITVAFVRAAVQIFSGA